MELNIVSTPTKPVESLVSVTSIVKAINELKPDHRAQFIVKIADGISFQDFHSLENENKEKFIKCLEAIITDLVGTDNEKDS